MGKTRFLPLVLLLSAGVGLMSSPTSASVAAPAFAGASSPAPAQMHLQRATPTPALRSDALRSIPGAECLPPDRPVESARLARVIEGDTLEVEINRQRRTVRLIRVNAPERGQAFYREATAALRRLAQGGPLRLVRDVSETDRRGRLLRYVFARETFVNLAPAREGFAQAMTVPPDVSCAEAFQAAEAEARHAGRGLWGQPAPTPTPTHAAPAPSGNCHPAYPTVCLPPPDLNCSDIPYRNFPVDRRYGDPHGLDGNRDGIACEK